MVHNCFLCDLCMPSATLLNSAIFQLKRVYTRFAVVFACVVQRADDPHG